MRPTSNVSTNISNLFAPLNMIKESQVKAATEHVFSLESRDFLER